MTKLSQIRACFLEASQIPRYHNKWYPDVAWAKIMIEHYNFDSITKFNVNRALPDLQLTPPLKLHKNTKRLTLSDETSIKAYFYLIDNKCSTQQLIPNQTWSYIYENYTIPRKKRNNNGECNVDC